MTEIRFFDANGNEEFPDSGYKDSYVHSAGCRCIMMDEGLTAMFAADPKSVTCPVCRIALGKHRSIDIP